MPYIKQESRDLLDGDIQQLVSKLTCAGDINYVFTCILQLYIRNKKLNYANINETIGALECCKLELYRRVAAIYEDQKALENGDVEIIYKKSVMLSQEGNYV
jgi:hypothetical protein